MSKIEKIRAEIKKRHNYEKEMYCDTKPDGRPNDGWAESLAIMGVLEDLLSFLDTLEEEPDKSLEEEIRRYLREECSSDDEPTTEETARHFAEWQKEQMLKDAVEGDVYTYKAPRFNCGFVEFVAAIPPAETDKLGDKVKLIVVKEDKE